MYAPSTVHRVYIASLNSVQIADDGGATLGAAVTVGSRINGLAVDPSNGNLVYAATDTGVYVSSDGGTSWTYASLRLGFRVSPRWRSIPATSTNIMAGGPELYRTTTGGATWTHTALDSQVTALAYDAANSQNAYACTLNATFYQSINNGATWGTGVATNGGPYCYSIVVRGNTIWIPTVGGGALKSTDSGATWSKAGLSYPTYAVAADPTASTIYVGTNWAPTSRSAGEAGPPLFPATWPMPCSSTRARRPPSMPGSVAAMVPVARFPTAASSGRRTPAQPGGNP